MPAMPSDGRRFFYSLGRLFLGIRATIVNWLLALVGSRMDRTGAGAGGVRGQNAQDAAVILTLVKGRQQ
jgi:hypothetical protein